MSNEIGDFINKVFCEDAANFLERLPSESVDMCLTSPPYDDLRKYKGFSWDFEAIAHGIYKALKPGGVLVWVIGDSVVDGSETLSSFKQAIHFKDEVGFNLHDTMIWEKDGSPFPDKTRYYQTFEFMFVFSKGTPKTKNLIEKPASYIENRKRKNKGRDTEGKYIESKYQIGHKTAVLGNVWKISTGYGKSTKDKIAFDHPAIFPEELAKRHIYTWSNAGETILDCFSGSGTTLKVARDLSRNYIGCEVSPEYIEIIEKRLLIPYNLKLIPD